ncbi:MAG: ABC transporter permease [Bacteroidales bacterium]|nr:ABC transporter permease [Bacteroidales bacterium]
MNIETFIARRILVPAKANFSRPIVRLAVISISLGLAVMIIAVAIVTGFQQAIRDKIIGFGSHIQITHFDSNTSYEPVPISKSQPFYPSLTETEGIRNIQVYATKAGIIKTRDQIQGGVLKGVGTDYDWSFFKEKIKQGKTLDLNDSARSNNVLISTQLASLLKLKLGDPLRMYFIINNQTRGRKFNIAGIYKTGLEEFDKRYVIGDIRHIQKLNGWDDDQVAGFEVLINDFDKLNELGARVYENIGYELNAQTIKERHPQMFDWLNLQDMNVIIILVLMVLVAGITMISTLLILILERTNMIGILKALGMRDWSVRQVFLYNAAHIIGRGLLWGNIIAIALSLLQQQFGLITLSQESYYVSTVPINLNLLHILALNAGTLAICVAMLVIPSYIITRITPVKAIRFE